MIELEIFEDKLQNESTINYNLSVLTGTDRFSYLVSDHNGLLLAFKTYRFLKAGQYSKDYLQNIAEILRDDELMEKPFQNVRLGIVNQDSTLIPEKLFNEHEQTAYIRNLIPISENEMVLNSLIEKLQIRQVFKVSASFYNLLRTRFQQGKFLHVQNCLIQGGLSLHQKNISDRIFVNVRNRSLQVCLFDHEELLFSNSFSFGSSKDFIYYILLVYSQFSLNPNEQKLILSGHVKRESEIYKLLYRYIRNIEFVEFPDQLSFGNNFKAAIDGHTYFDLYQLALCE